MTPEGLTALADAERPSNPFPGLRPFEFGKSHLYFGRDGQSDQLIRKLAATRFVAVVGTSGSGKSSLVRAGLLPDLFSGFMTGAGSHWRVALMRPGNDPLGNLAHALCSTEVFGSEIEENARIQEAVTEATLRRGGLGLVEAVRQNRMASNESLLVVVDQFEELFRFARVTASEQYRYEAAAFVKLLLEAARQREQNVYVVLTMRSDFLGDCSIFWDLPEAINEGQFLIPRMTRDQRAEAVTGPVAVCGGRIEQRLVNRLLNDTGDNPDLLPILQHALMRTWENWAADHAEGEAVDLRHYEAVGTMSDALSRHADEAFNELPNERSKQLAEQVFKALTEKGEDNREVRRPTLLSGLCALTGASVPELLAVLEVFSREGRSFLVVPKTEDPLVDISHESLIRNWARLKEWVDEESQSAQIYTRLAETAVLHERGQAGLWRDPDLQLALDWRERARPTAAWGRRYHPSFDASIKFLDASVNARDAEALEEERRRRREIRRTRVAAVIFFLLFMLSLAALTYANIKRNEAQEKSDDAVAALARVEQANAKAEAARVEAVKERDRANEQTDIAKRNEEIAKGATDEALKEKKAAEEAKADAIKSAEVARVNELAAVAAKSAAKTAEGNAVAEATKSRQLLYASNMTLAQQAYDAGNVTLGRQMLDSYGPDSGQTLGFEWFYLWNVFHGEKETNKVGVLFSSFQMSGDGSVLAINKGAAVELRDATARKLLHTIPTGAIFVNAMAVSRDGKQLAFAVLDSKAATLVNVETGKTVTLPEQSSTISALAFSRDGRTLAVGTELGTRRGNQIVLWDVATSEKKKSLSQVGTVRSMAFSPDGKMLAIDHVAAWLAGITDDSKPCSLKGGEGRQAVAFDFSPDGDTFAVANGDGSVLLFDTSDCGASETESEAEPLPGAESSAASALAFSPDGALLAVAYANNAIKVWDVAVGTATSRELLATMKGHEGLIRSVAFLPDSRTLVTGGLDGAIKFWDTETLAREQATIKQSGVRALAFLPDGKRLAVGGEGRARLWDVTDTREPVKYGYDETLYSFALSPDGKTLATAGEKPADADERRSSLILRDVNTFEPLGDFPQQRENVFSVAFSPDGRRLVTCGNDKSVRLWDVASRGLLKEVKFEHGLRVAFSPDGRRIVAGNSSGSLTMWDAELSAEVASYDYSVTNPMEAYALAFSPDGSTLAVAHGNGVVTLLDAASLNFRAALGGHKGAAFSLAFSPDGRTLATGGEDGVVKLWATDSLKELIALREHKEAVMSLAFSRDGETLASGGFDKVRLWHAPPKAKAGAASP